MTANFPPPFEVFEHTMFYDIDVLPPTVKPTQLVEPKERTAAEINLSTMSPRAQMNMGIEPADIQCRQTFELLMKISDSSGICVYPKSVEKLVQISWASYF